MIGQQACGGTDDTARQDRADHRIVRRHRICDGRQARRGRLHPWCHTGSRRSDGIAVARQLQAVHGGQAIYLRADLTVADDIEFLMSEITARYGGVDILVNNAVVRSFAPVEPVAVADWDRALAVNLSAAFHTIRLAVSGMRARGFGRIVNMSSVYGDFAIADRIDYVTTKTALLGLTRAVALETLADDITCNAICPGAVHRQPPGGESKT